MFSSPYLPPEVKGKIDEQTRRGVAIERLNGFAVTPGALEAMRPLIKGQVEEVFQKTIGEN